MSGLKPITVNTAPEAEPNICAEDDAAIYQSIFGEDGVSSIGQACKATVLSNNKVRIADGVICVGGHFARIPYGDYIDCDIENGQSGKNRNDIIVARFETTGTGGIDTYTCEVKKGAAGTAATDPKIVQEDLYKAGKVRELPLYRVKIEGLSITAVEQLFALRKTNEDLEKELAELNSKMMAGDYAVIDLSGWIFSYKQLGNNLLWFNIFQNINNQSASNRRDQGVKIPFTLPFDQHSFGHINVAGYPVGEDIFSFYKDGSVWMGSTGYDGYATYHASGILVIN